MTNDSWHSRRTLLKTAGTVALAGLAGCIGAQTAAPTASPQGHEDDHDDDHAVAEGASTEDGHTEEAGHAEAGGHDDGGHAEDAHDHGEAIGDPVEHAEVGLISTDTGEHFEPHVVRVQPGGSVTWTLESGVHTATAYHPDNGKPLRMPEGATPFDSGFLTEAGQTFEHTFETEGVYDYYCAPHEAVGMVGTVIVGEPDAHGQPGLEAPQSALPQGAQDVIATLNERVNEALGHTHD